MCGGVQAELDTRRRAEERRREMLRVIEQDNRNTATPAAGGLGMLDRGDSNVLGVGADLKHDNVSTNSHIEDINTEDEADDAEYESWKLRELKRLKRDKVGNIYICIYIYYILINPLMPSGNFNYRFKQCYSYESTILK